MCRGHLRGFIYSPVSVRFFFQLSSFSCDFLFVRFLSRPRSDFRLLLINCYFYDFMLTRKRDIIVINVQSSWISCSSMKFLSISRFYDFWCMRYERLPLTSSFLFFLCLLFSVCVCCCWRWGRHCCCLIFQWQTLSRHNKMFVMWTSAFVTSPSRALQLQSI